MRIVEKRKNARFPRRYYLYLTQNEELVPAILMDLSAEGFHCRCYHKFPLRGRVPATISPDGRERYAFEVEIHWIKDHSDPVSGKLQYEYGCVFSGHSEEWKRFLRQAVREFRSRREAPKSDERLSYDVILDAQAQDFAEQVKFIRRGGIFLPLEDPPPPMFDEEVLVEIVLPERMLKVPVTCRTVYIVTREMAKDAQRTGAWMQFVAFKSEKGHAQVEEYLREKAVAALVKKPR